MWGRLVPPATCTRVSAPATKATRPEVGLRVAASRVGAAMKTSTCWPTKAGNAWQRDHAIELQASS
jgi:hypothetical protein